MGSGASSVADVVPPTQSRAIAAFDVHPVARVPALSDAGDEQPQQQYHHVQLLKIANKSFAAVTTFETGQLTVVTSSTSARPTPRDTDNVYFLSSDSSPKFL